MEDFGRIDLPKLRVGERNKHGIIQLGGGGINPFREYLNRIRGDASIKGREVQANLGDGEFEETAQTKQSAIAAFLGQLKEGAGGSAFSRWLLNNQSALDAAYRSARQKGEVSNDQGSGSKFTDFLASANPEQSWWQADARDAGRPNSFRRARFMGG